METLHQRERFSVVTVDFLEGVEEGVFRMALVRMEPLL
jgi:hypothetical protein